MSTTIEATCTTCGTINRVGEADVPMGAKFVPCVSCKSRVALPPKASRAAPPSLPGGSKGDSIGLSDLPAPKRQSPLGNAEPSRPAPRSALADADLPAPRGARSHQPSTPPLNGTFDLDELLPFDNAGLPAPKARSADVSDLPAPRGAAAKSRAMTDLPLPSVADLPAPTSRPAMPRPPAVPSVADLPTPKSRQPSVSDLPAPVARGNPIVDLPTPRNAGNQIVDLPTPKHGSVIDLPTPKPGGPTDVPAPKGFFDDLPQPARNQPPPTKNPDLPAPKGFFDDLPGRVNSSKPEVPAPKGFFDDLPGRVSSQRAAAAQAPEVPAPKGFFDDLPGRPNSTTNAPQVPAPKGFFDDLPQPAKSTTQAVTPRTEKPSNSPVELGMSGATPLDLGLASEEPSQSKRYDDLDLSMPTSGIKIDSKPAPLDRTKTPSIQPLPSFRSDVEAPATLELVEPRAVVPGTQKLGPRSKSEPALDPDTLRAKARRTRILALVALLLVGLGAAGFYVYSRWAAKRAVQNTINEELAKAKTELTKSDIAHWDRAAAAAALVIEADPKHAEALGIYAEARIAAALATGIDFAGKLAQGRGTITKAVEILGTPNLTRAQALNSISQGIGDRALELLKPMVPADSKDPTLLLYMGWAYIAASDGVSATKMFDVAIANGSDYIKVCALYGRGQAKLEQADLEGANADFTAVLAIDKDHIGAQVGQAAALPASQVQQQEKDLLALFERKDFATGDPRAVVKAWSLAAEAAKRGGRLDAARERYRNALTIMPENLGALAGSAEIELRDNKLDAAAEQVGKALAISKDDIRSQLVQSEISVAKKDYNDARARVDALSRRNPPPPKLDQARIKMAAGRLAEFADGKDEVAAELYAEAARLAGEADLSPTLTAVGKYTAIAEKTDDQTKAGELRGKATELLEKLETQADKEPDVALALGAAYLRNGDAAKAETWLYKFVETRPDDAEGQFQLAKALARQGKTDDAIVRLTKAIERAPKRVEFRVELARTHERAKQDDKAAEIYEKLLVELKDTASVEVRAAAGRFFARKKQYEKAGEQGELILKVVPNHVVGQYLKGEGLLFRNSLDDARLLLGKAAAAERDTYYFEALGRAHMAKATASGEVKFQQSAIDAFKAAITIDPKNNDAHLGLAMMYMLQKQYRLAIPSLEVANKVDPSDIDVITMMGLAYYNLKDAQVNAASTAVIWFEQAKKLGKEGVVASPATVNYHLGRLYEEQNRLPAAASAFDEAVAMGITEEKKTNKRPVWMVDAQYFRGRVHNALDHLDQARDAWTGFLNLGPPAADLRVLEVREALARGLQKR